MNTSRNVALGALALACSAAWATGTINSGKVVPDGTNVWIGAATGGSMADPANWRAVSKDGYTVEDLFKKHCVYDIRGLADGAVLENDLTTGNTYPKEHASYNSTVFNLVAGIVAGGSGEGTWTIRKTTGKGLFFTAPCYLDIASGNLVWEDSAGDLYPYKVPTKRGQGTFWFKTAPTLWESEGYVNEGTLGFTNGVDNTTYRWRVRAGAKLEVAPGSSASSIAQVLSDSTTDPGTQIKVRKDAVLDLSTGFNNWASGYKFYGDLLGEGTLRVTGGGVHYFSKGAVDALAFAGTYQPVLGALQLGTSAAPIGVNPAASFDVGGSGWAYLYADATVANLTGTGADGGILYPAANTLTVDGGAATNVYSGRLAGGPLVKKGAKHTLVLTGETRHAAKTKVEAGTLAVQRGFNRPNLRAYWSFDDASDMGRDDSPDGLMSTAVRKDPTYRPSLVADGVSGSAVRFGDPVSMANGGLFFRARKEDISSKASLPRSSAPFTFSFWMRPRKGKCGSGTNFIHVDSGNGDATSERGETTMGVAWGSGFFFGSSKWDEEKGKAKSLPAFQNLAFYCGVGWTRGGAWNDAGDSKANAAKVAIAKFEDPNYLFDGNWHHVVGTYSNKIMRIFVDGVLKDERTRSGDLGVAANPYIQFGNYSGDTAHTYQGDLDEVQWLAGAWSEAEVAAEYAARNPRRNAAPLLPKPAAHWTFDAQKADNGFADVTGNGFDLENVPVNGTYTVTKENVTYADDPSFLGGAARISSTKGGYLRLAAGKDLSAALTNGASFTLALRGAYPGNGTSFMLGNGTAANTLYLGDSGIPRMQYWKVGASTYTYADSGTYGANGTVLQSAYCMDTIVYDAANKHLRIYRDGVLALNAGGVSFELKPTQLQWGKVGSSEFANLRLDDMRLYNVALTGGQVAEMVRQVRRGADYGADTKILPADAEIEVDAGATFATQGAADFAVGKVTGAGAVDIHGGTSFKAADYAGFAGTIGGTGCLSVDGTATVPSAATVTADVRIDSPTVPVAAAGGTVPYAETTGRVVVPAAGTLTVAGATQPGQLAGKRWPLATGASVVVPSDLSGWRIVPEPDGDWAFKAVDGTLYFSVKGGGTVIIVR